MNNNHSSSPIFLNVNSTLWLPILVANGTRQFVPFLLMPSATNESQQMMAAIPIGQQRPNITAEVLEKMVRDQQRRLVFEVERVGEYEHPSYLFELLLILFGLFGNTLTAAILLCTDLIRSNTNKYIFTIVIADSAYLLCAFGDLAHLRTATFWLCSVEEWIGNSATYISGICVVLLTMERFLAIVCPMEHFQIVDLNRWLIILFAILPLPIWHLLIMIATTIDTSANIYDSIVYKCAYMANMPFAGLGSFVSNSFHFFLPMFSVIFLNAVIAFKIHYSTETKFLTGAIAQPAPLKLASIASSRRTSRPSISTQKSIDRNSAKSTNSSSSSPPSPSGVPFVIFLIPLIYVLLNTPFHTVRFITEALNDMHGINFDVPPMVSFGVYFMYMANFASNSIVYALASSTFRRKVAQLWKKSSENISSSNSQSMSITGSRPSREYSRQY